MYIQNGDVQLFTVDFGRGPQTLLALGGWTGSWEVWADVFSSLSHDWRTVGFDHRGTGATIAAPESISLQSMVSDVFAVMDSLEIDECVLAAESSGGAVALMAALQQPQRFKGLVLAAGVYYRPLAGEPSPFEVGLQEDYQATVEQFVDWCVPEPNSDTIRHWGRQILLQATQESAIKLYNCIDGLDLRGEVGNIVQPALLIHGDADGIQPLEASKWLVEHLPQGQLHIIPGAGHAPMMTFPNEIAKVIRETFE